MGAYEYHILTCWLHYEPADAGGSIVGSATQVVNFYTSGTSVAASPTVGHHFVEWSDHSTANPRTDTTVTADATYTAAFAINVYTLKYAPGAGGTLTGVTSQTVEYDGSGTPVTARPSTGYRFVRWSDGRTANPRTDSGVKADKNVTAQFEKVITAASIARTPNKSTVTYTRRKGVAKFTLSAVIKGWGGKAVAGHNVYLQTSKNGRTWSSTYKLKTSPLGKASKTLSIKTTLMRHYRWYVPAKSQVCLKTYSKSTKVTVK